jgi:Tfp pilus assembly protein PilF
MHLRQTKTAPAFFKNFSQACSAILLSVFLAALIPGQAVLAEESESEKPASDQSAEIPATESSSQPVEAQSQQKTPSADTGENEALDHYELAKFYSSKWDNEMAEIELEAAIMYAPALKVAHRDYCLVSLLRGHPLRALAELMMVVGLGDPIPLSDEEKTALKAKAAKLHYRKALAYGRKEEWTNAISELNWAMNFSPNNAAIIRSLAFAYASSGDFDAAEKEYSVGFQSDPTDAFSHADFAFFLSDQGKDERALNELSQAVKLEPKAAALHVDLGWLAERKGDFETARNEIRQAITLSPGHAGLWAHLGRVLERQGKPAEAKTAYAQALAIDPQHTEARKRLDQLKTSKTPQDSTGDNQSQERKPS